MIPISIPVATSLPAVESDLDAWPPLALPPIDEPRALLWIDRRLGEFARRLESQILLDPRLQSVGDAPAHGVGERAEREQQELGERLLDELRSSFTRMVRDETKPMRDDAKSWFVEAPFFDLFSVDSSLRHPEEPGESSTDPALREEAESVTLVKTTRSPIPSLFRSVAEQASLVVPGDVDFGASVTMNRVRVSATYRPWTDVDAPALLRTIRIRASREYEDYWRGREVGDRFDCSVGLFTGRRSSGRLVLERLQAERETENRIAVSWVGRF